MPDVPTPPTGWTEHTAHRGMYTQPDAGPQTYKENSHTQIGLHTTTIISSQYTHRATAGPDSANARWETVRSYVQGGAGEALVPCAENIHCSIETSRAAPRQHASAVRIGKDTRLFRFATLTRIGSQPCSKRGTPRQEASARTSGNARAYCCVGNAPCTTNERC